MTCPEELEWSMYVDEALTAAETARLAQHLASCSACRARVDALGVEAEALRAALADEEREVAIPAFRKTPRQRGPLGAAAVLIGLATSSLAVADVLRALGWAESLAALNPFTRSDAIDFLFGTLVFIATEGRSMLTSTIETAGAAVVVALLVAAALAALRKGRGAAVLSAALAAIAFSQQSGALEVRRSEGGVSVAAGETIDDTLIAMGREVEINGRVTGDLIALGQRVVIRGSVDGQLVTGARHVEIEGTLGGSVLGAAETVNLRDAMIASNLYGFARDVTVDRDVEIDGNLVAFASTAAIAGTVGKDAYGFAGELEATGTIGGDFVAYAGSVRVREPARIAGDVVAHVSDENAVTVSPGAVAGEVRTRVADEIRDRAGRPAENTGSFLAGQAVRFGAAFVTGLILLWLVPPLARISLDTAGEAVTSAGIGLVALVAVPVIALMTGITLIGLPIAVLAMLAWLAALYLAKIVVAHFIGKAVFDRTGRPAHFALALLVGLLLVFVAINIPLLGLLLNFVLTITGLGMIVILIWGLFQDRPLID